MVVGSDQGWVQVVEGSEQEVFHAVRSDGKGREWSVPQ